MYNSVLKPVYNSVLKPIGEKAWGYGQSMLNRFDNINHVADVAVGAAGNIVQGAGNAAQGIGSFLGGQSNILLYIGIGAAALLILPELVDKVL